MPQLGETVTEGTITRWLKAVGDQVERDEPLFEVSTDKVDSEVPAPAAGVLSEILVPEGETVEVGVRLAVIGDGAPPASHGAAAPAPTAAPAPPTAAPAPPTAPAATPAPAPVPPAETAPAPPAAPAPAPAPAVTPPPPTPVTEPSADLGSEGANSGATDPLVVSPIVRRLLSENGIGESEVRGTGPGGRVTREDAIAVIEARRVAPRQTSSPEVPAPGAAAPPPPPPAAPPAAPPPVSVPAAAAPPPSSVSMATFRAAGDQVVPFSNMRRRTAEHMVRSKATSPHAFIANEVDFESVERVRKAWGERFKAEEGFALTYLPFVARAAVEALRDFPLLNASVVDDSLVVHAEVNLGVAVDLAHEGLIVPVIHRAEEVTLRGIARRSRDLAERARGRHLNADDISGGTFSITNDGPFGTYFTVPIINQPQVAILATDGIARRPVVITHPDGSESIAIHSTGILGVSWDHRAVDGAYVSLFLKRVSEILAARDWSAEL
jgi:pyruvate dehydrogenase E2 component (dihydrolipoamide acetyltransferase)